MSTPTDKRDDFNDDDDMLAAEYAVGSLPHAERQAAQTRIDTDTVFKERVQWWESQLVPVAMGVAPVNAPVAVWRTVQARLFGQAETKRGWWHSVAFWRGLAGTSLAGFAALVGVIAADIQRPEAPTDVLVAQLQAEASDVRLIARLDPQTQVLRIGQTSGAPAPERVFELWLIADGDAPVSLGVLPQGDVFTVEIPEPLRALISDGAVLAVSDEPTGGSPTGQPTGAVVAAGQVISL